jgi:hypothetical protein
MTKVAIIDNDWELHRHLEGRCSERNFLGELTRDPDDIVESINALYGLSPTLRAALAQKALRYMAEECIRARDAGLAKQRAEQEAAQ